MGKAGQWHDEWEVPIARVYPRSIDDWRAEITFFYPSNNIDIGSLAAYGSTFDQALANLLRTLQQVGYRGHLVWEGEAGELYGEIDMTSGKPKIRMCWQVDWRGLLAGDYCV